MRQYTFTENGFTFERVDKKQARKAYNNGLTVRFCPCNLRPGSPFRLDMDMNRAQENCAGVDFEKLLNAFEFYNCTNAIHALRCLVLDYSCCACSKKDEILCKVLSIVDGRPWDWSTIRGSCQMEWQMVFYPVDEWSKEALQEFETQYFNEGTEWIIHDEQEAPEAPEDISGYSVYCIGWNTEQIKKEIAEITGASPEEITLFEFGGYTKTAYYTEV